MYVFNTLCLSDMLLLMIFTRELINVAINNMIKQVYIHVHSFLPFLVKPYYVDCDIRVLYMGYMPANSSVLLT